MRPRRPKQYCLQLIIIIIIIIIIIRLMTVLCTYLPNNSGTDKKCLVNNEQEGDVFISL